MRSILWASFPLLVVCANASAQDGAGVQPGEQEACTAVAEPWKAPRALSSARDVAGAAEARFATGEAVRFALHPDGEVAYATLPKGEGEAESFGGLGSFTIERAGTYSVGLSEPIWVDVVHQGKPAETVRFGRGEACSGVRKAVTFTLAPGEHVLELSGSTVPAVGVMIRPVP